MPAVGNIGGIGTMMDPNPVQGPGSNTGGGGSGGTTFYIRQQSGGLILTQSGAALRKVQNT